MCKYCMNGVPIVNGENLKLTIISNSGGYCYLTCHEKTGNDMREDFKINSCPMCGEILSNENKDEQPRVMTLEK